MNEKWMNFKGNDWKETVNVEDFIINNYLDEDIALEDIKFCPTDRVLQAIYCNNGYLMKSKNKDEKDIMELD